MEKIRNMMCVFLIALIEKISIRKNIYERKENEIISQIRQVILNITGFEFVQYATKSRERKYFLIRMIFVYHCELQNIEPMEYLNRHRTTKYYYLQQYDNEYKYNREFRAIADKISNRINFKNSKMVDSIKQSSNNHQITGGE
jgi:hypothetical protein